MEDLQTHTRFLNPWVLHLQKLGLELKCPSCLNLYNKPILLPCNHIFCSCCVPESKLFGSDCPICKVPYVQQDLREAPYMENLVNIYRSLDASFSMHMLNSGNATSGTNRGLLRGNERVLVPNSTSVVATLERCSGFANPGLRPGILEHNFQSNVTTFSQGRAVREEQHITADVDMNRVELSPDSPPSSGASKGIETDSRDDTAGQCRSNKTLKRAIDGLGTQESFQEECPDLYSKKQKQMIPSMAMNLETSVSTGSATEKCASASGDRQAAESNSACVPNFKCAFCKTWKVTKGSGPMQHFANGSKQVFGDEAGRSNVVHLHQSCIEWTPQIYYEDDTTIRNVDKELARAEKLKCTSCGLKGAALGCFAKSCRRTYHAPCAYEIAECRWDSEDFLMLCPAHSSLKFPSEKSRKSAAKKSASAKIHDEPKKKFLCASDSWMASVNGTQNWVLCASSLSADQKSMLVKFVNMCGATITKHWTPEVTHVIAATDMTGACSRTLKVLMAILKGRWVLKTDWVEACMERKCPVDEEPYEINLDNHGCCDGPKTGRLRALSNAPMLFSGLKFYFSGDFIPSYRGDLQDLISAGGGTILESREHLQQCRNQQSNPGTTLVVYNDDAVTGTGDVSSVLQRQVEAEMVAAESGSQVVPHTWMLGSIASNRLQHPFV
ncbi:hypothetical protein RND81_05G214200 [Saponaria officinalis]|uniref:RING-type E3 ubiquitin transferase BRCA1 n=1 Tax=Saponaria officinalis TaxID=3572 RepID=A0AAW1L2X2_SAPOF